MNHAHKFFTTVCLLAALTLTTGGCIRGAGPVLSKVAAGVSDAALVLDLIQSSVNAFFAQTPKADVQAKIQHAIDKSRLAVSVAIKATHGAQALSDDQVAAAFLNFQKAYGELQALLSENGLSQPDGSFAGAGGYRSPPIPPPLALSFGRP